MSVDFHLPQMKALPCLHTVQSLPLLLVRYSYEYVEETRHLLGQNIACI